ncbi:brain-specific homeobox protein-like [Symsagittifera roscoffensis]|uniref:brain-specific homeobox protein-like n=1 Tax=Symsagittifera roscoffensis TaxID=84072 RepID=UPI00307B3BC9
MISRPINLNSKFSSKMHTKGLLLAAAAGKSPVKTKTDFSITNLLTAEITKPQNKDISKRKTENPTDWEDDSEHKQVTNINDNSSPIVNVSSDTEEIPSRTFQIPSSRTPQDIKVKDLQTTTNASSCNTATISNSSEHQDPQRLIDKQLQLLNTSNANKISHSSNRLTGNNSSISDSIYKSLLVQTQQNHYNQQQIHSNGLGGGGHFMDHQGPVTPAHFLQSATIGPPVSGPTTSPMFNSLASTFYKSIGLNPFLGCMFPMAQSCSAMSGVPGLGFNMGVHPGGDPRMRIYRRRKARTVFSDGQLHGLERKFQQQRYLSTPERIEIATQYNLTETQASSMSCNYLQIDQT